MISNLKVGLVTEGTVESLQTYGAFVGLGNGIDGLVHISQITNTKRLKHPKEMLSVGDKVKVKVTGIKDGKISLSMKACEETSEAPRRVEEEHVQIPKRSSRQASVLSSRESSLTESGTFRRSCRGKDPAQSTKKL